ncbi:mucoidy inhibitor MuiA family protein [Pyxidicoccus fallax]|uniref:Mucoidy inhibitor MuiA family protein n=1 Tax=Pyxidicoccus fallax TaxID=394095 RepID=A0A848LE98_9BACT|nr:mucoidy inhibitor MuiA family protein [Pyxidicoccus fallax]NMO14551.1 mucoidy inhibitor MuiA family protein [Pyxidicoccus fallax]NPC77070.1 mucoidy inhibitor MuiA family protein [Pyxidicoccus fallax]
MPFLPMTLVALATTSQISSVVIYPDRAQVTRAQTVTCTRATTATFEHIPPAAAPESFRARATNATLEGLTAETRTREAEVAPERAKWETRALELERELHALDLAANQAKDLERLSQGFTEVAVSRVTRELTGAKPDVRVWGAAFDSALAVRLRAVKEARDVAEKQRAVQQRQAEADAELARLNALAERSEQRVEVRLSCPEGTQVRVELTYLVGGTSWEPLYEARAEEGAGIVELTSLATVRQQTGEDWAGAKLFLSTAQPRQDATPPEVTPLYVSAEKKMKERKVLVRREEQQQHAEAGVAGEDAEGQGLSVSSQGLSVQWEAQEATRVPGDGSAVRVRLGRHRLKANLSWRTVPKLHPVVFRVARLANTTPFPLLPGPVSLFRDTGFLGHQRLERVAKGSPFELTFGLEEGLRVKRTVVEEVQKPKGLFGGKQRFRYAYRFQLTNHRARQETVELSEHVPVSELEDVKVELEPESTAGYTLAAEDGIATWKVALAPGQERTVDLVFHVDAPSSYDTGGL